MGRHIRRPTDELAEMPVDGAVTFATAVLQPLDIDHMDVATAVADQTRLLQFAGDKGDAAALHNGKVSLLSKSRDCSSQRLRRSSNSCSALHAATCCVWAASACSCRTNATRRVSLSLAALFRVEASIVVPSPSAWTIAVFNAICP